MVSRDQQRGTFVAQGTLSNQLYSAFAILYSSCMASPASWIPTTYGFGHRTAVSPRGTGRSSCLDAVAEEQYRLSAVAERAASWARNILYLATSAR